MSPALIAAESPTSAALLLIERFMANCALNPNQALPEREFRAIARLLGEVQNIHFRVAMPVPLENVDDQTAYLNRRIHCRMALLSGFLMSTAARPDDEIKLRPDEAAAMQTLLQEPMTWFGYCDEWSHITSPAKVLSLALRSFVGPGPIPFTTDAWDALDDELERLISATAEDEIIERATPKAA